MPKIKTLHDLYVSQVRDIYYAEKQLVKALPKMAKAAKHPQLAKDFLTHADETQTHIERLEDVFDLLELAPRAEKCDAIIGIVEEAKSLMEETAGGSASDAALILAGQKAEHYEISTYGSLIALAETLEYGDQAEILKKNLTEEKVADEKLTNLAESRVNEAALDAEVGRRAA